MGLIYGALIYIVAVSISMWLWQRHWLRRNRGN